MAGITEFLTELVTLANGHPVLSLGLLLVTGYFFGRLAELVRLPAQTGYIVGGLVLSVSVSGALSADTLQHMQPVSEVALALIAITIGGEFHAAKLRHTGLDILVLTLLEAIFAFAVVSAVLIPAGMDSRFALLIGAICAATAPATTVVIIREMRARGPFVDYLYGVVAFDDAVGVVLFSIIFAIVTPQLVAGATAVASGGIVTAGLRALLDIFVSSALGCAAGLGLHLLTRRRHRPNEILIISLGVIFVTTALVISLDYSALMANMVMGATLINLGATNRRVFAILEPLTPPIFALFFILAGTQMQLSVFATGIVVVYGLLCLVGRFAGKSAGIYLGARLMKSPAEIRRYLGFCLFPQAGVALGLTLFLGGSELAREGTPYARQMVVLAINVVLLNVFINQLIGPVISRYGIAKGAQLG